jgi:hypothetical protein
MATWKVSYIVKESSQPGGIINLKHAIAAGDIIKVGNDELEILEAEELIPPRGEFHYVHVTCKLKKKSE